MVNNVDSKSFNVTVNPVYDVGEVCENYPQTIEITAAPLHADSLSKDWFFDH